MTIPAASVASQLALRLQTVVPSRFVINARGSVLAIATQNPDDEEAIDFELWLSPGAGSLDVLPEAMKLALSRLQDFIAIETRTPWPGRDVLPLPDVAFDGTLLRMWFGDSRAPDLELAPIPISALAP
jgi:hypothetical protein